MVCQGMLKAACRGQRLLVRMANMTTNIRVIDKGRQGPCLATFTGGWHMQQQAGLRTQAHM
jgi:hypothetical protein